MTYEDLCAYLLKHPGTIKEHPLGKNFLAFKVKDKVFAMLTWQKPPIKITLKSKLQRSIQYQKKFPSITPGNINNQTQWITLPIDGSIPLVHLLNMIDESYELILKSLKKSVRDKLQMEML